jgi:UDP-N-acetylglucosamine 2-epimerase (non-hydrolysing)
MNGRVAVVLGTRPEILKMAEIIELLGDRAFLVHTGQHWDHGMSGAFMEQLRVPDPAVSLAIGGGSRAQQIAQLMLELESTFQAERPDAVMVQGDTNSVVGAGLTANALGIPLVHVEAGLRSFDRAMPEEHNRVVTDHLSDLCLAPTEGNRQNLLAERIPEDRIVVTGNTIVGVAARGLEALRDGDLPERLLGTLGVRPEEYILATVHRPENTDTEAALTALFSSLAQINHDAGQVVLPLHPRTRARLEHFGLAHLLDGLRVLEPLGYEEFTALAARAGLLISDSGGVQEEASVWKRPVIVVRRSTERQEGIGTFAHMSGIGEDLVSLATELFGTRNEIMARLEGLPSPYGDLTAAAQSIEAVDRLLSVW